MGKKNKHSHSPSKKVLKLLGKLKHVFKKKSKKAKRRRSRDSSESSSSDRQNSSSQTSKFYISFIFRICRVHFLLLATSPSIVQVRVCNPYLYIATESKLDAKMKKIKGKYFNKFTACNTYTSNIEIPVTEQSQSSLIAAIT